jgi:hypothetical protein
MPLVEKDSTLDMPFVKLWHGLCRKDAFFLAHEASNGQPRTINIMHQNLGVNQLFLPKQGKSLAELNHSAPGFRCTVKAEAILQGQESKPLNWMALIVSKTSINQRLCTSFSLLTSPFHQKSTA